MPNTANLKLRSGFIISLDACLRYLRSRGFTFTDVQPSNHHDHRSNEQIEAMCDEERRMEERQDLESAQIERVRSNFRHLRRKAPEEVRVRLVLPHGEHLLYNNLNFKPCSHSFAAFISIIKHKKFGERLQKSLFLPTGTADSVEAEATSIDYDRLRIFIDTTSGLLGQHTDNQGADFTPNDFTFDIIPAAALFQPVFNTKELKVCCGPHSEESIPFAIALLILSAPQEFVKAGREAFELYGISVDEFMKPYRGLT